MPSFCSSLVLCITTFFNTFRQRPVLRTQTFPSTSCRYLISHRRLLAPSNGQDDSAWPSCHPYVGPDVSILRLFTDTVSTLEHTGCCVSEGRPGGPVAFHIEQHQFPCSRTTCTSSSRALPDIRRPPSGKECCLAALRSSESSLLLSFGATSSSTSSSQELHRKNVLLSGVLLLFRIDSSLVHFSCVWLAHERALSTSSIRGWHPLTHPSLHLARAILGNETRSTVCGQSGSSTPPKLKRNCLFEVSNRALSQYAVQSCILCPLIGSSMELLRGVRQPILSSWSSLRLRKRSPDTLLYMYIWISSSAAEAVLRTSKL